LTRGVKTVPQCTVYAMHAAAGRAPAQSRLILSGLLALALLWGAPLFMQTASAQVPCCMDESELEERIEDDLEEDLADDLEDAIEDQVASRVDQVVGETIEESIEESIQDAIEESVESTVEETVAAVVEKSVEESVAVAVEKNIEESVAASVEGSLEQTVAAALEDTIEFAVADAVEERLDTEIDSVVDQLESRLEIDEARINTEQWLVMAEPEVFDELAVMGYLFDRVTDLPGMGLLLAEVEAPSSFEIYDVREGVIDVVGRGRAEVDLNHVYTAGAPVQHSVEGSSPRSVLRFPADTDNMPLRLGMIDSLVDIDHPALSSANIHSEAFTSEGAKMPSSHGTAIASIFIGRDKSYVGLAPQAELYAAAVFEQDASRGEIASTVSLVRALDWLMSSGVDVVNISLAGPPNRLLEKALERAALRGVVILAAAGNGGPMAKPMYPAAYTSVIAVTAVDASGRIFRLANRGEYVDLAAPGVGLLHARSGGGYATSSGTSFAVPFVATAAARLRLLTPLEDIRAALIRSVQDEGSPGRDDTYGYGVLRFAG
jgi:hypothetical protein